MLRSLSLVSFCLLEDTFRCQVCNNNHLTWLLFLKIFAMFLTKKFEMGNLSFLYYFSFHSNFQHLNNTIICRRKMSLFIIWCSFSCLHNTQRKCCRKSCSTWKGEDEWWEKELLHTMFNVVCKFELISIVQINEYWLNFL